MHQEISVKIKGKFPNYKIKFSADPEPVPRKTRATFKYAIESAGFRMVSVNLQCEPFHSKDQLTWTLPADRQSVTFEDVNKDKIRTFFGIILVFEDALGNRFSSADPQVENEGLDPP